VIASAHFAAAVAVGMASAYALKTRLGRVALAFVSGFVLHLLMDAVPHSDYAGLSTSAIRALVPCEMVVVGAAAAYVLRHRLMRHWPEYLSAGLLGSVLPDVKFVAKIVLSDRDANLVEYYFDRLHVPFHTTANSVALGVTTQIVCAVLLLALLNVFPRTQYRPFQKHTSAPQ